ncbi:MAG: hypothetical protein FJZ59_01690 [Chlamydiae bacterium]|nr:hypothetical protein [Chlamydiota bacterium]
MLITITKPHSSLYEPEKMSLKPPSPLADKPLLPIINLLLVRRFTFSQKMIAEERLIRADLTTLVQIEKNLPKKLKDIITSYWHLIVFHPFGEKIHKAISRNWKKCMNAQMNYILDVFKTFNSSSNWSEIPNQIAYFTSVAQIKIRGLIKKNLHLPASIKAVDCENHLYAYALFQANLYSFYLTNLYLRKGIDLCIAGLSKRGYDFTASLLVRQKPKATEGELRAIKNLISSK